LQLKNSREGYLLLEDGKKFRGYSFLGSQPCLGEAVFNTSHTGYQEILTDPSYSRQIIVFTAPHIGNVGVNSEDNESDRIHATGAVVRSIAPAPRSWRSEGDLPSWLAESNVPLLSGVDTRSITLHLRERGAMRAGIFPVEKPVSDAMELVKSSASMTGSDLATEVSCNKPYSFPASDVNSKWNPVLKSGEGLRTAVIDFGVKRNILRELACRGCEVTVLPAEITAEEIKGSDYDGVLISNGPGDPAAVLKGIETISELLRGNIPLFGICLGHQLLALAAGLKTFKLRFGHRGANHPVKMLGDGIIEISSQNHGFAVDPDGLRDEWQITHLNLNDGTVEGLEHSQKPFFSIQYHPEASPGPHEGRTYFDRFIREMRHAKT